MINTFLILKTVHNEEIRVCVDEISSYETYAHYLNLTLKNGNWLQILGTVEQLDSALAECYVMIKRVEYVERKGY